MKPKLEMRTSFLLGFALSHSHFLLLHEFPFSLGRGQSPLVMPTERGGPEVTITSNDLQRQLAPSSFNGHLPLLLCLWVQLKPPSSCTLVLPT